MGKKRVGGEGDGLFGFHTLCLFSCVCIAQIGEGGKRCTLVMCSVESGCKAHKWLRFLC